MLATVLWIIIAIALIVWLIGLVVPFASNFIWILLLVAVVVILVNLLAVPSYKA